MKVLVSNYAWFDKSDLPPSKIALLKSILTVLPRKVGDYPGQEEPQPIHLYEERGNKIGVAREYFLSNRSREYEIEYDLSDGSMGIPYPLKFKGTLRAEQSNAVAEVAAKFRAGQLGGILQASAGWGKCQAISSTYVTQADTGSRVLLGELIGKEPWVPSLHADGRIVSTQASKVWNSGVKPCMRLTLASGQWLEASHDHPVLTQLGWKKLSELQPGREVLVATARTAPEPSEPYVLADAEVITAGLYLADGTGLGWDRSQYCKGNAELVALFESSVAQVPGFSGFGDKKFIRGAWYVCPHGLLPWLREQCLNEGSKNKSIPSKLFGLPSRQLALLIRAIWTDGNLYLGKPRKLEIALASEGMIDGLQEMLRRFSIVARKSFSPKKIKSEDKTYDAWRLQIADKENLILFAERVGVPFGMEKGFEKLLLDLQTAETNTNWDVVPVGHEELREIRKECKHLSSLKWKELANGGGMRWMSRSRFETLLRETGYTGKYADYASKDVVWEGVESVNDIGPQEVADLTVPETGNVVANGLVVHNTVFACALMAELRLPTLVTVHKEFLMDQWKERIATFLPDAQIGHVQQDVCDYIGKHVVLAMVHTLAGREFSPQFWKWPGLIITDESIPEHSKVLTDKGYRKVSEIVADPNPVQVVAYDQHNKSFVLRPVLKKWVHTPRSPMLRIEHEYGSFECTAEHVVITPLGDQRAGNLQPGADSVSSFPSDMAGAEVLLWGAEGRLEGDPIPSRVLRVTPVETPELVYDLSVEEHHNFVVEGVVLHNCHRIGAHTWSPVPGKSNARHRLGITATPRRKDGAERVFEWQIGPRIFKAREQRLRPKIRRVFTTFQLVKTPNFNPSLAPKSLVIRFLVANPSRNKTIAQQLILALKAGRKLLVLSERLNHLDLIQKAVLELWDLALDGPVPTFGKYVGGRSKKELESARTRNVVLATSQYAQEGLDVPELDTLYLTTPLSDVEQAVGRILRPYDGKKEPIVVDFRDDKVPMLKRMADYREAIYAKVT